MFQGIYYSHSPPNILGTAQPPPLDVSGTVQPLAPNVSSTVQPPAPFVSGTVQPPPPMSQAPYSSPGFLVSGTAPPLNVSSTVQPPAPLVSGTAQPPAPQFPQHFVKLLTGYPVPSNDWPVVASVSKIPTFI